jgi:hypothetical protein
VNVTQVITQAAYLSGVTARGLSIVNSEEGTDGLFFLNLLLSEKGIMGDYIPYYTFFQFPTVAGQETYFVPNLATADTITFNDESVRYVLIPTNRRTYFGAPRANAIQSLPYICYLETVLGGANIWFYFLPNQVYTINVEGRFQLSSVTYATDLDTYFDLAFQSLLIYELTERFCESFLISMNPTVKQRLEQLKSQWRDRNYLDLNQQKVSTLAKFGGFSYAQVNIGRGWTKC